MATRGRSLVAVVSVILAGCSDARFRDPDAEAGQVSDAGSGEDAALDGARRDADEAEDGGAPNAADSGMDTGSRGQDEAAVDAAIHEAQVAQTNDAEAGSDSGPIEPPDPDPDTWAGPLLGNYAVRTDSFSRERILGGVNRIQEISLVTIERIDSKVWLTAQTCYWHGESDLGFTDLVKPSAVPPRRERVRYAEGGWRTEPSLQTLGYNAEIPPACTGKAGLSVPKQPGQSWLSDTCSCPAASGRLPVLDDCRVTDPDGDGAAGIAYRVTFNPPFPSTTFIHVVQEFRFSFQDGMISDTKRHSAHEAQPQQAAQLSCEPSCGNVAQSAVLCPPSTTRVQFAPLASDAGAPTCEQALELANRELKYSRPADPSQTVCPTK